MGKRVDDVAQLVATEQIKRLKACYFRFVDTKDWDGLRSLFCDHATLHYTDADIGPQPIDQAMAFVRDSLADATTLHHGHDRKSTRLNSSPSCASRMPYSALKKKTTNK